jgi:hypothetical protein
MLLSTLSLLLKESRREVCTLKLAVFRYALISAKGRRATNKTNGGVTVELSGCIKVRFSGITS